jgi:hypothetical protein
MDFLSQLWQPIVAAAVLVFIVSSVIHMALPIHKSDKHPLPAEGPVLDALRQARIPPGEYMFPGCKSMKDMGSPEMLAKYQQGPVGLLTMLPNGPPAIGKALIQWFIYSLLVSAGTAYLAWHTLPVGAHYLAVFRVTGMVAFMTYGVAACVDSIWKGQPWSTSFKYVFDGLLYAFATAGAFGWLWPQTA